MTAGRVLTCLRSQMENALRQMKVSQWEAWESGCAHQRKRASITCARRRAREEGAMATKMRRCGSGARTELTFQRRFCRRTARCSLWRGRGREEDACEKEVAGSEWHERASYDELMEDAPREVVASVERACLSMDASRDGTRREYIPSEIMLDASSWRAAR